MSEAGSRIDVWLWCVRLSPSRSKATAACKGGKVSVNGAKVKASARVVVGDTVTLSDGLWPRIVVVTEVITARVGAPRAVQCYLDKSPARPPREQTAAFALRDRGTGRPTKRDRRQLDKLRGRNAF